MEEKRGVSLVILVVTILVLGILASIIIISTTNSLGLGQKAVYADEMRTILDSVNEYYILNGKYPVFEDTAYTKANLVSYATSGKQQLENVLSEHQTDAYYRVDMSKLEPFGGLFGMGKTTDDYYYISSDATQIYYPKGFNIEGSICFSLEELIAVEQTADKAQSSSNINISYQTDSIVIKKSTEKIVDELTIDITTTVSQDEMLYLVIGGVETQINSPYSIKISDSTLTDAQIASLKLNKIITVEKRKNSAIVAKAVMDISNLGVIN